jgi:hypothetical protein
MRFETVTAGMTATLDFFLPAAPRVLSDADITTRLGKITMTSQKLVAHVDAVGGVSGSMTGTIHVTEGALRRNLVFPHARLDLKEHGAYEVTATTKAAAAEDAVEVNVGIKSGQMEGSTLLQGGLTGLSKATQTADSVEAHAVQKLVTADKNKMRVSLPKFVMLVLIKSDSKPRALLHSAYHTGSLGHLMEGELGRLKDSPSTSTLGHIFKELASRPDDKHPLDGQDKALQDRTHVHLDAAVIGEHPIRVVFAGSAYTYETDGVVLKGIVPLSAGLQGMGLYFNLGDHRVPLRLDATWNFLVQGIQAAKLAPSISIDASKLNKGAFKQALGDEITFDNIKAEITSQSWTAWAPTVRVKAHMGYQPYADVQTTTGRPAMQKLTLKGEVSPTDAKMLQMSVTAAGEKAIGSWPQAFGVADLSLSAASMTFVMEPELLAKCPGPCGISTVDVRGMASLHMKGAGAKTSVLRDQLQGQINIAQPDLSEYRIGSPMEPNDFKFPVATNLAKPYSRLYAFFPIQPEVVTEHITDAAKGLALFKPENLKELTDVFMHLGPELYKLKPFVVSQLQPSALKTHSDGPAFSISYTAKYFGQAWSTHLPFNMEQMLNARKGTYREHAGIGVCPNNKVLLVGHEYTNEQAKRKCDSLEACKSFMLGPPEKVEQAIQKQDAGGTAFFCSVPMLKARQKDAETKWSVAIRDSGSFNLMDASAMRELVRIGLELTLPKVMSALFTAHAELYGFEFKPTIQLRKGKTAGEKSKLSAQCSGLERQGKGAGNKPCNNMGHFMDLQIKATEATEKDVNNHMQTALLMAVKYVTMMPHGYANGKYSMDVVTAKTVGGAMDNMKAKYMDLSQETYETLDASINEAQYAIEKAFDMPSAKPVEESAFDQKLDGMIEKATAAVEAKQGNAKHLTPAQQKDLAATSAKNGQTILAEAKAVMGKLNATIEGHVQHAKPLLEEAAAALKAKMPELLSVTMESILLECLYDDVQCSASVPKIKVCFTEIGCDTVQRFPGIGSMMQHVKLQAKRRIVAWLRKMLTFKDASLTRPDLAQFAPHYVNTAKGDVNLDVPGHLDVHHDVRQVPDTVNKAALEAFKKDSAAATVPATNLAKHAMPKGLRKETLIRKVEGNMDDTTMKDTWEVGMNLGTNMEKLTQGHTKKTTAKGAGA